MDFEYEALPKARRAALGVIVLSTDEVLEPDFRSIFAADDVDIYTSRIFMGAENTPETLGDMAAAISASAALFPRSVGFDVVGYGCTSASAVMGSEAVAARIGEGVKAQHCTDPFRALVAASKHLGIEKLAMLSPYGRATSEAFLVALARQGLEVVAYGSFNEAMEARVPLIAPQSIEAAAIKLANSVECDAIFLSCTNLRTLGIIERVEAASGKIVLSSNQLLAWHMARLAGIDAPRATLGRVWQSSSQPAK